MFTSAPANNAYLELIGETFLAQSTTRAGFNNVRTMEVLLDIMLLNTDDPTTQDSTLFGQESFWWFYFDQASASTFDNLRFLTTRNQTNQATWGAALDFGKRYIFRGKDDGESVSIRVNGSSAEATDATSLGTLDPIDIDTTPIKLGSDAVYHTALRLYSAWVSVNGVTVLNLRPKVGMAATIPDLSPFGNDFALTTTQGTDYLYGPAWNRERAFSGKESLV